MKKSRPSGQSGIDASRNKPTELLLQQQSRNLEELLAKGDFRKATGSVGALLQSLESAGGLPLDNPWRAKAAAIAARLCFYHGDHPAAHRILGEYATHEELFLGIPGLRVGQKLVLGEYSYSRGEFRTAITIAERILADCETQNDLSGMGEACHFLSRCYRRLHQDDDLRRYCDRSRECFLQHFLRSENMASPEIIAENVRIYRWRIGLSCLIEGYSLWSRGDTLNAHRKLTTAKLLLENTGDFIDEANVLQSLGSIARSEGNYEASLEYYYRALELYIESGHSLNRARTLTNIGRTYLGAPQEHIADRPKAREKLEEALDICRRLHQTRQKAEVLVIMSWLYLHQGNPAKAEACASEALRDGKLVDSPGLQAEAKMAIGYCRYQKNDPSAVAELLAALQYARTFKLQVSAHLALAEVLAGINNVNDAVFHLREAEKMLDPQSNISSIYLSQKLKTVRAQIDMLRNDYFLVTFDAIKEQARMKSKPRGLSKANKDLERWAIVKALEESAGGMTQAAQMLGLARQAFWQRKKRARLK